MPKVKKKKVAVVERKPKPVSDVVQVAPAAIVQENPADRRVVSDVKVKAYRDTLIWLRDEVVSGNDKHVERINRVIGG